MQPRIDLCSPRNSSCTNEDVWEDSAKVLTGTQAPTENQQASGCRMIRSPARPEQALESFILRLPGRVMTSLPTEMKSYRIRLPVQETRVQSPRQEDPLKEEMATHSSILAWKIPWTKSLAVGSQRVRHDCVTACTHAMTCKSA